MKIYIDFDRTLFDCETFLKDFYAIINKYQIPKDIFMKCQNQCKKQGFNPGIILDKVAKEYEFDENIYHEIDNLLKDSHKYLYKDAIKFLKELKKLGYQIIILTKGNEEYQREKIMYSNIDEYYSELIVTMKHKGKLDIDYQEGIFIDDNPIEIESILKRKPKNIIRINRTSSKYSLVELKNISTVKSLDEIIEMSLL